MPRAINIFSMKIDMKVLKTLNAAISELLQDQIQTEYQALYPRGSSEACDIHTGLEIGMGMLDGRKK